jgi:hypothetical protein
MCVLGSMRSAVIALVLVGCSSDRTPSCEEAARHTAEIMKQSNDASKRAFWSDERVVEGQIRFCKQETPNPTLLRCARAAETEQDVVRCRDQFVGKP